ncbi:hypothetical protein NDU88_002239 [Pleurodeles waltl]|uniref:Uncharacterized protein n=1 Tax=Pleurodeles waltl TaxID=8319 RepID=A0AAV7KVK3_PLEWA|nr:hypothetical protein NDU88_002239 [Pleurodeles waltl]
MNRQSDFIADSIVDLLFILVIWLDENDARLWELKPKVYKLKDEEKTLSLRIPWVQALMDGEDPKLVVLDILVSEVRDTGPLETEEMSIATTLSMK